MSSSTSSFKTEARVLLLVGLVLLGAELSLRALGSRLSLDEQHIRQIPAIAASMTQHDGARVLFFGNSLTRRGVNRPTFEAALHAGGVDSLRTFAIHPDDTGITEWYFLFKNRLVAQGHLPDYLVLGFAGQHLQDRGIPREQAFRLAQHYGTPGDIAPLFATELTSFDQRTSFLLAMGSSALALHERVGRRLLNAVVPNYRMAARRLNQTRHQAGAAAEPTYHYLESFLQLARDESVQVVVVAMPQQVPYTLDPALRAVVVEQGGILLDLRQSVEGTETDYLDPMHLSPSGARVYSKRLAQLFQTAVLAGEEQP